VITARTRSFRTEWWYVTGVLDAPRAEVGFQLTFFRTRSGRAEQLESPLAHDRSCSRMPP
jgi:predicted secreted hydrolase